MKPAMKNAIFLSGVLTVLFMVLPILHYDDLQYTGYEVLLGKELISINPFGLGSIASARLPFSLWALIGYFLPLLGGISILMKERLTLISSILFLGGFFALITLPNKTEVIYVIAGIENTLDVAWTLGIGLVGSMISAGIGAILAITVTLKRP